jgi:hypothetical protein
MALDHRPWVEVRAGLDATLGDVLEAACDDMGIRPGNYMIDHGLTCRSELFRFAFVEPQSDRDGINPQSGYAWPGRLPAPDWDGNIVMTAALEVTVRQLLVSSELGLIRGDVTRPYIYPVKPQGAAQVIADLAPLAPDIVRTTLNAVKGIEGDTVWLIHGGSKVLHGADLWTSQHPIEAGITAIASKGLLRRARDHFNHVRRRK